MGVDPQIRRWRSLTGRLAIVGIAALTAGCKSEASVQDQAVRPVKVAIIAAAPQGRTLSYSGVVRPRIESALGFRVPGKIVSRVVNVGDRIKVDQVIAQLDETDLKLAENAAKAAVASARSRRDVAKDNLDRAKVLLPKAIISQAAYDTRRNELDSAEAGLDTAEAQLRQATNAVGYTLLKADKPGIVTAVTGEPGQVVNAGQTVATLAEVGETEIALAVPEQDAGRLNIGQPARIALWVGPRASADGRIREIAGQADPASRTYAVRIAVDAPPQGTRLGMTASVALAIDDGVAPIVVPLTALTEGDSGPVAFVVDQASKIVRRTAVTVAGIAEDGAQIAAGLQAGDIVVTAGVQFLRDGMRVRLLGERVQEASAEGQGGKHGESRIPTWEH
jgi:multidrug efflux system membrane fusion protein